MCPSGTGYNYFLACDTAERIIFAIVAGSGSGKLCRHSRGERQRSGKRRLREGKRTAANRRSALRKCRNAVSAGVLFPISSAVGRNGAVGDKEALAPLRGYTSSVSFADTCLPAGRSVRGSDRPPACHSTPRTHQGGRLWEVRRLATRTHQGGMLGGAAVGAKNACRG